MAEGAGFEPALPFGKHAFQACALSHSATPPIFFGRLPNPLSECNVNDQLLPKRFAVACFLYCRLL